MICKKCGMDSKTTDICEWCKKPLVGTGQPQQGQSLNAQQNTPPAQPLNYQPSAPLSEPQNFFAPPTAQAPADFDLSGIGSGAPPPMQAPPQYASAPPEQATLLNYEAPPPTQPNVRVSLTGEVIEVPPSPPPQTTAPPQNYGAGTRLSELPVAAAAAIATTQRSTWEDTPLGERWEKFLALYLPILAISIFWLSISPGMLFWLLLGNLFLLGILLGASRAVESYDDAYMDIGIVLVLNYVLGPVIAFVIYFIVGMVRQEIKWALVGILGGGVLVRYLLIFAFANTADISGFIAPFAMMGFVQSLPVKLGIFGWILSSFFRPIETT